MKNYIIFPINQTQGMEGYSAIAIEKTAGNLEDIQRMVRVLTKIRKIDPTISRITYDNPMVDIILFNDDFYPMVDKIHIVELSDVVVDDFIEELLKERMGAGEVLLRSGSKLRHPAILAFGGTTLFGRSTVSPSQQGHC